MKLKHALATLPLVLNACGGEESSTDYTPNELGQGIWEGGFGSIPVTNASASGAVPPSDLTKIQKAGVGLYTSDKRVFFYNVEDKILFTNDTPGLVGNNLYYSPDYYINGSALDTINFTSSAYISTSILGGYSGGVSGTYIMLFDDKYFRGADLVRLQGSWNYSDDFGGWSISVASNGDFTATLSSISSCAISGMFSTIDASKNEYAIDNVVFSNCDSYNGSYTGLAATVDTNSENDTLLMAIYNADNGFFLKPVKQ